MTHTESVNENSIEGRLERALLKLADLGIAFERTSKSPEVNLVHVERILASRDPHSQSPGVYSPPAVKPNIFARAQRNIEAIAARANERSSSGGAQPIQLQPTESHQASTDARHRAINEDDPITRAALHGRANEASEEEAPLTMEARAKLRAAANAEPDARKRALLHQRAAK